MIQFYRVSPIYFFDILARFGWDCSEVRTNIELKSYWVFRRGKCYLSEDRNTGFAILNTGEIVALFNTVSSLERCRSAAKKAREEGGTHFICLEGPRSFAAKKLGWILDHVEDNYLGDSYPRVCYFRLYACSIKE